MRSKPLRSKFLREHAKDAYCMACGLPGSTGEVVLAHIQPKGHGGMGTKPADFPNAAYLCAQCHSYMDIEGRGDVNFKLLNLLKQMDYLLAEGIIVLAK